MFFCNFCKIAKNVFFIEPLWETTLSSSGCYLKTLSRYYTKNIKMTSIETNANIKHNLSVAITLKAVIQNKLSKS